MTGDSPAVSDDVLSFLKPHGRASAPRTRSMSVDWLQLDLTDWARKLNRHSCGSHSRVENIVALAE
jgi:hypothetical protein